MNMPTGLGLDQRIPHLERLEHRRLVLAEQLEAVEKAITSLKKNPELADILDAISCAGL